MGSEDGETLQINCSFETPSREWDDKLQDAPGCPSEAGEEAPPHTICRLRRRHSHKASAPPLDRLLPFQALIPAGTPDKLCNRQVPRPRMSKQ